MNCIGMLIITIYSLSTFVIYIPVIYIFAFLSHSESCKELESLDPAKLDTILEHKLK